MEKKKKRGKKMLYPQTPASTSPSITTPKFHENDSPIFTTNHPRMQPTPPLAAASQIVNETTKLTSNVSDEVEWNDNLEKVASAMCDMAQVQLQLCMDSFRYYETRDMWLSLPVAIIGSVIATGIAVVQQRSNENPGDSQIVMYVFSGLGILVTIMKIVNSIFAISDKKNQFENVRLQWERFVTYVSLELYKDRKHRMPARLFFERYVTDLVQLQKATPDIPRSVVKRFIRLFEGKKGSLQRTQFHELFKPFSFPTLHPTIPTRKLFFEKPLEQQQTKTLSSSTNEKEELARFTPTSSKLEEIIDAPSFLPKNMFTFLKSKQKMSVGAAPTTHQHLKTIIEEKESSDDAFERLESGEM